jgi:hypothetical protein
MSAGARAASSFARALTRGAARGSGHAAPTGGRATGRPAQGTTGAERPGGAVVRGQPRRDFRAIPRATLRARAGPRTVLRHPRAACPAMLDLFLYAWDDLDDS